MRHITKHIYLCLFAASFAYIMVGCKAKGNYPGTDFMPDMGPSLAYEANYHIDYENSYLKFSHRKFSAGNGVIVANGAYPAAPPAFTGDEWVQSEEGRYYHAIMHGKGVMGHYKDKLSDKERWEVIHYIRSKQIPGYADNA